MAINITQKTLIEVVNQVATPYDFLQNVFFPTRRTQFEGVFGIDIYSGAQAPSLYVTNENSDPTQRAVRGFERLIVTPYYIKENIPISKDELRKIQAGETEYGSTAMQKRFAELVGRQIGEAKANAGLAIELQCVEALTTGKINITPSTSGASAVEVDFKRNAGNTIALTGTAAWGHDDSDPWENIRSWKNLAAISGGLYPNTIVMGYEAADMFLRHPKIKERLDTRRSNQGEINSQFYDKMGATYHGRIDGLGVDVWEYVRQYKDKDGNAQFILPSDKVILGNTGARTSIEFGSIIYAKEGQAINHPVNYFVTMVEEKGNVYYHFETHPIAALSQADAFISVDVKE